MVGRTVAADRSASRMAIDSVSQEGVAPRDALRYGPAALERRIGAGKAVDMLRALQERGITPEAAATLSAAARRQDRAPSAGRWRDARA